VCAVAHRFAIRDLVSHCGHFLQPVSLDSLWQALDCATKYNIRSLAHAASDVRTEVTSYRNLCNLCNDL
jgi:hypothetical protein